jgi:hypothetical protein
MRSMRSSTRRSRRPGHLHEGDGQGHGHGDGQGQGPGGRRGSSRRRSRPGWAGNGGWPSRPSRPR